MTIKRIGNYNLILKKKSEVKIYMTKYSNIAQETYDIIVENMPIACVDVVIYFNESIILVKRNTEPAKGEWWLPGGRVIKGEMLKETAHRKALEETGIDCVVGSIIHTAETVFDTGPNGIPIHSINTCFFLCPKESNPHVGLDSHSTDFKWISEITKELI